MKKDPYELFNQVEYQKREIYRLKQALLMAEEELNERKECKQCVCAPCGLNGDKVCRP